MGWRRFASVAAVTLLLAACTERPVHPAPPAPSPVASTETIAALACPLTYESARYPRGSGRVRSEPVPLRPVDGVVWRYPHTPDGDREGFSHAARPTADQLGELRRMLNSAKLDQRTVKVCDTGPADVIILRRLDGSLDTIIVNDTDCGDFYSSRTYDPKAGSASQGWRVSPELQSWLDTLAVT